MRLPDFLIIGAMKAGTTSLYRDLLTNPRVFFPIDKEPGNLTKDDVLTETGRRAYAVLFNNAGPDQICGEASTQYTKLPDYPGVPQRARSLLGSDIKIIYLVRNPVDRAISHHRHLLAHQFIEETNIDKAVYSHPDIIHYSQYAMQVTPWLESFDESHIKIILFEDYIANRYGVVQTLSHFLQITPRTELVETETIFNRGADKPIVAGPFAFFQRNPIYRRLMRPLLRIEFKDRLRKALLPPASPPPPALSGNTLDYLIEQLQDDAQVLGRIMGLSDSPWNFEKTRANILKRSNEPE